jgi:FixJ family two-component response regulator
MVHKNTSILVVDDDADVLLTAQMALGQHFFEVILLEQPVQIPEYLNSNNIDLVLLDMNFSPGLTSGAEGIRWLRKIRALDPFVPIVMNTAFGDIDIAVQAMKFGANDFLVKPWTRHKLLATIKANLESRPSRRKDSIQMDDERDLPEDPALTDGDKDRFPMMVREILNQHIAEPEYSVDHLAIELNLSRSQVFRKVRARTGFSPKVLLRNLRLERAARMFRSGHKNVTRVMYHVGFNNASYFAKCFSNMFGINPSQYISRNFS